MSHGGRIGGDYDGGKPLKLWERIIGYTVICGAAICMVLWMMIRSLTRPQRETP